MSPELKFLFVFVYCLTSECRRTRSENDPESFGRSFYSRHHPSDRTLRLLNLPLETDPRPQPRCVSGVFFSVEFTDRRYLHRVSLESLDEYNFSLES